ncbi:MAG: hypothetical protein ACPLRW_12390 [Moorellales bacterium]
MEAMQERKVVRHAELMLEVTSVEEAVKELEREAAQLGGLVAQAEFDRYDARTRAHLECTCRRINWMSFWPGCRNWERSKRSAFTARTSPRITLTWRPE